MHSAALPPKTKSQNENGANLGAEVTKPGVNRADELGADHVADQNHVADQYRVADLVPVLEGMFLLSQLQSKLLRVEFFKLLQDFFWTTLSRFE